MVSFEASPQNFSTLQRNISANNLNNVELVNLAVFSNCGTIGMSVSPEGTCSGDWSICRQVKGDSIQVQTISLDQFCEVNQVLPDFLKIDVEGAEYDVLIGGRETIGRSRPTMLIELHHFDGDLASQSRSRFVEQVELPRFNGSRHGHKPVIFWLNHLCYNLTIPINTDTTIEIAKSSSWSACFPRVAWSFPHCRPSYSLSLHNEKQPLPSTRRSVSVALNPANEGSEF